MNSLLNLPWVWLTYDLFAIAGMFMLAVVGSQADNDLQLKRWETINLRRARRISFRTAVLFLGFTILAQGTFWEPSLIATGNLIPGMLILGVNSVSLNSRVPPANRGGNSVHVGVALSRRLLFHPISTIHRAVTGRSRRES